jgi:cytoskeletal protein CcmA (bactofilin family)
MRLDNHFTFGVKPMFGRKGQDQGHYDAASMSGSAAKTETAYGSPVKMPDGAPVMRPNNPALQQRRPDQAAQNMARRPYAEAHEDVRRLTVGREITLTGEIATCDVLVVEGNVSATLRDGRLIEITEAGMFQGTVEIDNADIAGKFEGDLIVHDRLTIRSTGRITGRVQYGELEVQAGGQIVGEIQSVAPSMAMTSAATPFKDPAKVLATLEEDQHDMLAEDAKIRA